MTQVLLQKFQNKFVLLFCLVYSLSFAQDLTTYQEKYKSYSEVILQEFEDIYFTLNKGKINVSSKHYEEILILEDKSRISATESIYNSDFVIIKNFEAFTINNISGKNVKIPHGKVIDKRLERDNIFDSDTRLKHIFYNNLQVGSKKILKYELNLKDPFLLHRFTFQNYYPAFHKKIRLIVDPGIQIGYLLTNTENYTLDFKTYKEKNKTVYQWEAKDLPIISSEEFSPSSSKVLPHINYYIKSYESSGKKINMLNNSNDLYQYYKNFIENLNTVEDKALKDFTLNLIKNASTEKEKVQLIFNWVQNEIKYVAFESGYEGFIPRQASLVFERRFADCKDMSSLITAMAKYAGITNVYLTWIGTNDLPYSYSELPSPAVDNHMIATYITNKDTLFLDATNSFTKFGLPSQFIQGKEALISIDNQPVIQKVPKLHYKENKSIDVTNIKLQNGILYGNSRVELHNYLRSDIVSKIKYNQVKDREKEFNEYFTKGNNTFKLFNIKETNFEDKNEPYLIDFDFTVSNYTIEIDNEIYLNLMLNSTFENKSIDLNRKNDLDFKTEKNTIFQINFQIPNGYKVDYIPKNAVFENEFGGFDIKYQVNEKTIQLQKNIYIKKKDVAKTKLNQWNELVNQLKPNYLESIKLIKL